MTAFAFGTAVGIIVKTLLPWPWADDRIRAGWRWLEHKAKDGW